MAGGGGAGAGAGDPFRRGLHPRRRPRDPGGSVLSGLDPSTLAVVLGRPAHQPGAPVNTPVMLSSTFRAGGPAIYGRDDNETREAFEAVLGGLEGGTAVAFGSGMAAISAVIEMLPIGGPVVVGEAYNGTRRLLADSQSRGRLTCHAADVADTEATLSVCASAVGAAAVGAGGSDSGPFAGGGLLWLESPTNPLLAVADLPALIAGAHDLGMSVAVDNTFATPLLQQPLNLGADVVVHSVTKMLGGHSDLLMGAAVARSPALVAALINRRSLHGAIPGPLSAFLALRGMRTLSVRLERAQSNAGSIASRLVSRAGVSVVRYPGLVDDPGHDLALRQMRGFGAMVSFDLEAGAEVAEAVCSAVRVITPGTSLGGVETLIERRGRYVGESHLPPGLLRLSVGIEAIEDLWADLDQAIGTATGR